MDPDYTPRDDVAALSSRAQLERISEPWALNRNFAIIATLGLAMLFGTWAAGGQIENIILVVVGFAAVMTIIFVRDFWWTPPLVISAFGVSTMAAGFPLGGMEIGVVIVALTFPVKMAMKTLRKAQPEMRPSVIYWILLGFVATHFVCTYAYNNIQGTPVLKNIVKAYYIALTPLIFYGLLIRYCHTRTIRPTVVALFFTTLLSVFVAIVTVLGGYSIDSVTDLSISFGSLNSEGAIAVLRISGPLLFIGAIAFWPTSRSLLGRFILGVGAFIGGLGTLVGGSRLTLVTCIIAGVFFAVVRKRLWLAIPIGLATLFTSGIITAAPNIAAQLPFTIQRALAPLNFSDQGNDVKEALGGSDDWHRELRTRSYDYWTQDTNSFYLGHGYKSWDPSLNNTGDPTSADIERRTQLAVEMGLTENMFSSITNIFGIVGLILYGLFLIALARSLYRVCRAAPIGSDARALAEFSLVNLVAAIGFCFFAGSVPGMTLIFWQLGVLAGRQYLTEAAPKAAPAPAAAQPDHPAFARPAFANHIGMDQKRGLRIGRA